MSDLVKRLRKVLWSVNGEPCANGNVDETCATEAAARIEELARENKRLREAKRGPLSGTNYSIHNGHQPRDNGEPQRPPPAGAISGVTRQHPTPTQGEKG